MAMADHLLLLKRPGRLTLSSVCGTRTPRTECNPHASMALGAVAASQLDGRARLRQGVLPFGGRFKKKRGLGLGLCGMDVAVAALGDALVMQNFEVYAVGENFLKLDRGVRAGMAAESVALPSLGPDVADTAQRGPPHKLQQWYRLLVGELTSLDSHYTSQKAQQIARTVVIGGLENSKMVQAAIFKAKKLGAVEDVRHPVPEDKLIRRGLAKDGCRQEAVEIVFTSVKVACQAVASLHRQNVGGRGAIWARQLGGEVFL